MLGLHIAYRMLLVSGYFVPSFVFPERLNKKVGLEAVTVKSVF
jgi:hypothetical protein